MLITHGIPENMEERPWTKSEFFAWNDGRRIVDLYELSKQLQCKRCSSLLDLRRTEREARYGLASVLYILCNCGVINDVHTAKTQQDGGNRNSPNLYEVNIKASINLLMYGAGASRILSFLALLDIPVPPPDDTSLIVPFTEDAEMRNVSPPLPTSPTTTTSVTSKPSESNVTVSDNLLSFQKTQPSSTSSSSCVPNSEFSPVPHPLPPDGDSSEFAVPPEETDNEEELNEDEDDDDDEYVPPSKKPKSKFKPKFTPASRKLSLLRGPKNARTQKAAKQAAQKQSTKIKIKVKRIKEEKETPKNIEEIKEENEEEENSKHYANPVEWSSSESDTESTGVKAKDSDTSWQEDEEEEEDQKEDDYIRPKRKRGRPRGSTDKAKRARKFEPPTKRVEEEEEEKDLPKCTTCAKDFSSIKGYNVHMKRVHNQEIKVNVDPLIYICTICKQPFARDYSVLSHIEKKHWTPTLDPKEQQIEPIDVDLDICIFVCDFCYQPYARDHGVISHIQFKHWTPNIKPKERIELESLMIFVCAFCHLPYAREHRVVSHLELKHWSPTEKTREMFFRILLTEFIKQGDESLEDKKGRYSCLHCNLEGMSRQKTGDHMCISPQGYASCITKCPEGKKLTKQDVSNLFHVNEKCSLCDLCGAQFSETAGLECHLLSVHGQASKRLEDHKCDICGAMFPTQSRLNRHKAGQHSAGPRPKAFMCDYCGKAYPSKSTMFRHRQFKHISGEKFHCEYCPKKFFKRHLWIIHTKRHLGEAPHQCSVCGKDFSCRYNLKTHERIHTGEKPYHCQLCDASFAQKTSLDVHMKKHRLQGESISGLKAL